MKLQVMPYPGKLLYFNSKREMNAYMDTYHSQEAYYSVLREKHLKRLRLYSKRRKSSRRIMRCLKSMRMTQIKPTQKFYEILKDPNSGREQVRRLS